MNLFPSARQSPLSILAGTEERILWALGTSMEVSGCRRELTEQRRQFLKLACNQAHGVAFALPHAVYGKQPRTQHFRPLLLTQRLPDDDLELLADARFGAAAGPHRR